VSKNFIRYRPFLLSAVFIALTAVGFGGTATDISGLYYTGVDNSGAVLAGGATDSHWTVTYARVNGNNYTGNSTYTGASYVLSPSYIDAAYVANSASSKWITAPGASTAATGGTTNVGGDYLPGNGDSGANRAQYVYRLAFTVVGTGSGNVTNNVSISLTLAADDRYRVYLNPTLNANGSINTGSSTLAATRDNAWNNTSAAYLQNYTDANSSANSTFVVGTNYIYVVVDNTNSIVGTSGSNALNPSGLLVYQVGALAMINGNPVPEVGTVLPVVAALGLFGWQRVRSKRRSSIS
jgi:hypothetical protein